MEKLTLEKRQLCDIQGRLFELALKAGYDCPFFIEAFMNSKVAAALDDVYDRMQWAGEEYILEELNDEVGGLKKTGISYSMEVSTGADIRTATGIIIQGSAVMKYIKLPMQETMNDAGPGFHTLDVEMAIDDLKEIYDKNGIKSVYKIKAA